MQALPHKHRRLVVVVVSCVFRYLATKATILQRIIWSNQGRISISPYTGVTREALGANVNDLSRVAAGQCGGRESNRRPVDRKSSSLATALPSYPVVVS